MEAAIEYLVLLLLFSTLPWEHVPALPPHMLEREVFVLVAAPNAEAVRFSDAHHASRGTTLTGQVASLALATASPVFPQQFALNVTDTSSPSMESVPRSAL